MEKEYFIEAELNVTDKQRSLASGHILKYDLMNDEERNKAKNSYTVAFRHCDGNDKVSEGLFQNSRQYSK